MTYKSALKAAGAEVLVFAEFGSYQGDWYAKVKLKDGKTGWVHGSYGSCSVCDALQAQFDYGSDKCGDHQYQYPEPTDCQACNDLKATQDKKFADFGASYLTNLLSQEEAEKQASENITWDGDAPKMLQFLKDHAS